MDNPTQYVIIGEGDEKADWVVLSNLEWGKEQALKTAKGLLIRQRIYKLVPVYEVDVRTVHEFPVIDATDEGSSSLNNSQL